MTTVMAAIAHSCVLKVSKPSEAIQEASPLTTKSIATPIKSGGARSKILLRTEHREASQSVRRCGLE